MEKTSGVLKGQRQGEFRVFVIHSFSEYLLSIYYVPNIVLGMWNRSKNRADNDPCRRGAYWSSRIASPQRAPTVHFAHPSVVYPSSQLLPACPSCNPLVLGGWELQQGEVGKMGEVIYFPDISQTTSS